MKEERSEKVRRKGSEKVLLLKHIWEVKQSVEFSSYCATHNLNSPPGNTYFQYSSTKEGKARTHTCTNKFAHEKRTDLINSFVLPSWSFLLNLCYIFHSF